MGVGGGVGPGRSPGTFGDPPLRRVSGMSTGMGRRVSCEPTRSRETTDDRGTLDANGLERQLGPAIGRFVVARMRGRLERAAARSSRRRKPTPTTLAETARTGPVGF